MPTPLTPPIDADQLLRKKKAIRRELLAARDDFEEQRIALLGGSTTAELRDILEIVLLDVGIKPIFYESDYNRYFDDLINPDSLLKQFKPDFIYLYTTIANITRFPEITADAVEVERMVDEEIDKFRMLWDRAGTTYKCPVIQNNFELPHARLSGNLDCYMVQGRSRFVVELNRKLGEEARARKQLYLNDINYLSAWFGLERWYDLSASYAYKYAMSPLAIPHVAHSVGAIINAIVGKTKKCLVLDLDNTVWGGVVGDDGLDGIRLGSETAEGEGYAEFQRYIKGLKERGVILAVCSKNDKKIAEDGFGHPAGILALDDFADFQANWSDKQSNLRRIAQNLNIGVDSLVFIDDNPVEREIVRAQEPLVAVPEMGADVTRFITVLDKSGLFEPASLSAEDLRRTSLYSDNSRRASSRARFETYEDFLISLEMTAEIGLLTGRFLDRAVQLCNKTNQFTVTTRRVTAPQMIEMMNSPDIITIYGRLNDKFGDNGLVSLMSGDIQGRNLLITLWLMSCRVLQRGLEGAMLDRMVELAKARGVTSLIGTYLPTAKNNLVADLFPKMGFHSYSRSDTAANSWLLDLTVPYQNRNRIIRVSNGS